MAKLLDVAQMRCRLEGLSHANLVEVALAAVANDTRKLDEAMAALRLTSAPAAFKPLAKTRSSAADGKPDAIVVVDPLSTGARLAAEAQARGFLIVRVMSQAFPDELLSIIPAACGSLNWKATVMYDAANPGETVAALKALPVHLLGILVGCESGVECHDALTTAFGGFPSNGIEKSLTRRDKHPMGEAVRAAGLRAVKQKLCGSWAEAKTFCGDELKVQAGETGAWCVLKPCKSAGTDGVFIAKSLAEAEDKFGEIVGKENVFGETNAAVLVQEFMKGTEFVVDSVSVEGTHKCVAIWVYDKRPCNGAQFVYYSMDLYTSADGEREDALVKYVHGVLDALGVRHGPSHAEVMWLDACDEPCLVEVGCRPHGGEGTFVDMAQPCIGYSQLSVMLDAVEKPYRFHRLPTRPQGIKGGSSEVCLIAHQAGVLAGYPAAPKVRELKSYLCEELKAKVGDAVPLTVDFLTTPGSIMLVDDDAAQIEADKDEIHELCKDGLMDIIPASRLRLRSF
mmetsp:Transcript_5171/g.16972  ORF Transcript_5171/g.16972 Transcript_5171/m.16972 type:complete len:510 (-) Transcript_5171:31-1560(-)